MLSDRIPLSLNRGYPELDQSEIDMLSSKLKGIKKPMKIVVELAVTGEVVTMLVTDYKGYDEVIAFTKDNKKYNLVSLDLYNDILCLPDKKPLSYKIIGVVSDVLSVIWYMILDFLEDLWYAITYK